MIETVGVWRPGTEAAAFSPEELQRAALRFRESAHVVREGSHGRVGVAFAGEPSSEGMGFPLLASLPPLYPEWLGDRTFGEAHGVRFPYATGPMANGIATTRMVIEMARAGMLGFFGSAGLPPARVEAALDELERELGHERSWGINLIHSPNEPDLEEALCDLYLKRGVARVDASAFMNLTPAIVRYAASGLRADGDGRVLRRHHVFAKISRPEVAQRFLSPAPGDVLDALVARGALRPEEARLAAKVPLAEDVTVESDSGGHTDNRPLGSLFPAIAVLRDRLVKQHGYSRPVRLGAAGGLGTPASVASAFALGAAYVMTGTVNQGAVESGLSEAGRKMLADAGLADVIMAPAADMFELGVKVQVLRRGSLFAQRALRLYELYVGHDSLEAIPEPERVKLEKEILRAPWTQVWEETRAFFEQRDPRENARAEREPKHKMALVFRSYLGRSSKWAIAGDADRRLDYQIWCGPAMGAFNDWARGSFLEAPENRTVVQIARNFLEGAAAITRAQQLRTYGAPMPAAAFDYTPRRLD
jgi:PfaD family protein